MGPIGNCRGQGIDVVVFLANKTQVTVSQAIAQLRLGLPFLLLGLDSDNGSEFINDTLLRYCQSEQKAGWKRTH